jgi:hypothetical protein
MKIVREKDRIKTFFSGLGQYPIQFCAERAIKKAFNY